MKKWNADPRMNRWEVGSEFHFLTYEPVRNGVTWPTPAIYYGSGRDAMRGILAHGTTTAGWQRLWVPIYFCQDVVAALKETGLELVLYADGPDNSAPNISHYDIGQGDLILLMNYFGLRHAPTWARELQCRGAQVLEDHSHDPWSAWAWHSEADWCVASLRKTLPLPDGGLLWSPKRHIPPVAPPVTAQRHVASLQKLAAMVLKELYLSSNYDAKHEYRSLALAGEEQIAEGPISGMPAHTATLLDTFPIRDWRIRRRANVEALYSALDDIQWLRCLSASEAPDICPFGGILLFDSQTRRDHIRVRLIEANVYPAILWSLTSLPPSPPDQPYREFSQRMLMIHCDMRYTNNDMRQVAELITQFGEEI